MLAAIGIILLMNQVPLALGYDQPISGKAVSWRSSQQTFLRQPSRFSHHVTARAILISLASLALMIVMQRPFLKTGCCSPPAPGCFTWHRLAAILCFTNSALQLKASQLVNIPPISSAISISPVSPSWFQTRCLANGSRDRGTGFAGDVVVHQKALISSTGTIGLPR